MRTIVSVAGPSLAPDGFKTSSVRIVDSPDRRNALAWHIPPSEAL
jgi:hypothetical protein